MKVLVKIGAHSRGLNKGWANAVKAVEGMWVEIETDYLFEDQFNTVPIPHSSNGVRLMAADVMAVEDDVRPFYKRCTWCGRPVPRDYLFCLHCGHSEYLVPFRSATT